MGGAYNSGFRVHSTSRGPDSGKRLLLRFPTTKCPSRAHNQITCQYFFFSTKSHFRLLILRRPVAKKTYSIKFEVGGKPDIEASARKPQTWRDYYGNLVNHRKAVAATSPAA